jgi:hypothetical protein
MANYAVTTGYTPATLETFLETQATTVTFTIIPYKDDVSPKFLVVTPACNAVYAPG